MLPYLSVSGNIVEMKIENKITTESDYDDDLAIAQQIARKSDYYKSLVVDTDEDAAEKWMGDALNNAWHEDMTIEGWVVNAGYGDHL